jgi:hypothetical protein
MRISGLLEHARFRLLQLGLKRRLFLLKRRLFLLKLLDAVSLPQKVSSCIWPEVYKGSRARENAHFHFISGCLQHMRDFFFAVLSL